MPQVDVMIDVADRSGRILRAMVTHLGDRLSESQRRKAESQFGDLALLKHILEEDLAASEWIGELWGEVTTGSGLNDARAFATLFNEKSMEHYPLRYVDQLVQNFLVDTPVDDRVDDRQRQFISCGLLTQPERLSEENFYTAFTAAYSPGSEWFERHADFFTPERVNRFVENAPWDVIALLLLEETVSFDDGQLGAILEKHKEALRVRPKHCFIAVDIFLRPGILIC